ncbi:SbcC/MukB-like Walker B domain-containing protein [Aureibacillus halotolerans]|uniref:Nuclease SbcCD subunit C n=1 Tax=Aureibacillus halotolerans TaxID=1508390 RepID=A0A4R6U6Y7_9BACI|nr:SbcC/MukB-like Walker B domain-containing protein [Aureibacillus halotolerans]TDQ42071.1 exonuclease SbcC [Aureibacillus halotolerans]
MKPVSLEIEGLNSFREKQVISFTGLCQGGVFGIFGPTGSGKSTILDAITLALYGKVERAEKNTQGIMNQQKDELRVALTFSLENEQNITTYRVERKLKRTGDISMQTVVCRFLDVTNEPIVLDDKTNEVNRSVQQLLGLSIEDFTRAVVLPQGKFAEFLSLKGTDRRQMLQRLFQLEKYGDQLSARLKDRKNNAQGKSDQLHAEKEGIGDASKHAVDEAKHAQDMAKKEEATTSKQKETAQTAFEEAKKIRQWQDEETSVKQLQFALQEKRPQMEAAQEAIVRSEAAQQLMPALETLKEARSQRTKSEEAYKRANEKERVFEQRATKAAEAYEQVRVERETLLPSLLERRSTLEHSRQTEQRLTAAQCEVEEQKSQLKNYSTKQDELQKKETDENARLAKGKARQEELHRELQSIKASIPSKEIIQKASTLYPRVEQQQRLLGRAVKEVEVAVAKLKTGERKRQSHTHQKTDMRKKLQVKNEQLFALYEHVKREERHVHQLLERALNEQKRQTAMDEEARADAFAYELAQKLHEGQPCLVCGSTHHPDRHSTKPTAVLLNEQDPYIEVVAQLHRLHDQTISLGDDLQLLADKLVSFQAKGDAPDEVSEQDEQYGPDFQEFHNAAQVAEQTTRLQQTVSQARKDVQHSQTEAEQLLTSYRETSTAETYAMENEEQLAQVVHDRGLEQESEEKALFELQTEWETSCGTWCALEEYKQQRETYEAAIEKIEDTTNRLEQSVTYLQTWEKNIVSFGHENEQLTLRVQHCNQALSASQATVTEAKASLEEVLQGEASIEQALERVQETIDKGKQQLEEKAKESQAMEADFRASQQQRKSDEDWLQRSKRTEEQAADVFNKALQDSLFADEQQVLASMLDQKMTNQYKQQWEAFKEELKHTSNQVKTLEEKLENKRINDAQWQSVREQTETAHQQWREAVERLGYHQQHVQSLQEKHLRYSLIEKEQTLLQDDLERMQLLEKVLKGNSFVEFMAEEQLMAVCYDASEKLRKLTKGRYAVEVDSQGGFVIRDDLNGGSRRPVQSLSGGETFMTSLSLALALSTQIQLRGQYPLQFFFLDEGFGTLDQSVLDTVVSALEELHGGVLSIGLISHVPALQERLVNKLYVHPPTVQGKGSQIEMLEV